jgi:hypothetical protein
MKLQAARRTAEQRYFSGHRVHEGYWVDVHLLMVPYTSSDRQVFLDLLDAIKTEARGRRAGPRKLLNRDRRWR